MSNELTLEQIQIKTEAVSATLREHGDNQDLVKRDFEEFLVWLIASRDLLSESYSFGLYSKGNTDPVVKFGPAVGVFDRGLISTSGDNRPLSLTYAAQRLAREYTSRSSENLFLSCVLQLVTASGEEDTRPMTPLGLDLEPESI